MDEKNVDNPKTKEQSVEKQPSEEKVQVTNTQSSTSSSQEVPGSIRYRLAASFFDGLILGIPSNILGVLLLYVGDPFGTQSSPYGFLTLLMSLSIALVYFVYFDVNQGATPGKRIYGMKVIDTKTKGNLTYQGALVREAVNRGISGIPFLGILFVIINVIVIAKSDRKRGIHDKLANSQVMRIKESWSSKKQFAVAILLLAVLLTTSMLAMPKMMDITRSVDEECYTQCAQSGMSDSVNPLDLRDLSETCFQECSN